MFLTTLEPETFVTVLSDLAGVELHAQQTDNGWVLATGGHHPMLGRLAIIQDGAGFALATEVPIRPSDLRDQRSSSN